jgi:putative PIN family toxin of toxin-antitoxin system
VRTITLDSNIYISALIWGGKPLAVLEAAISGEIRLAITGAILSETLRVMRVKFRLPEERIATAEQYIARCTELVQPVEAVHIISEDPDDDRVLECAAASASDAIVTGDRDLLRRGKYRDIPIITASQFLEQGWNL